MAQAQQAQAQPLPGLQDSVLYREFYYYGPGVTGPNAISAADLLREIDARKLKNGWNEAQTLDFFRTSLRENASRWYETVHRPKMRLLDGPATYTNHARPAFAAFFEVNVSASRFRAKQILQQRPNELAFAFGSRLQEACSDHIETARLSAPQADYPTFPQRSADYIAQLLASGGSQAAAARDLQEDINTFLSNTLEWDRLWISAAFARHLTAGGLRPGQPRLEEKVEEFCKNAAKPNFDAHPATFIELLNAEERKPTSITRVTSVEEEPLVQPEDAPSDDIPETAAVRRNQPRNQTKKPKKKQPQPPTIRQDKYCTFCSRRNHYESECFTKKRAMEAAQKRAKQSAQIATEVVRPSAPAYPCQGHACQGNANGAW